MRKGHASYLKFLFRVCFQYSISVMFSNAEYFHLEKKKEKQNKTA